MKKLIYLLIAGCAFFFSSCEKIEVGYLVTGTAGYPIDTLYIYDIGGQYDGLVALRDGVEFSEKVLSLTASCEEWEAETQRRSDERYDYEDDVYYPAMDAWEANPTQENTEALDEAEERLGELVAAWKEARKTYWNYLDELDAAILEIAGMTKDEIYDGIEKIQNTITYQIPWFTSSIQGVLGTEPLQYSIVSVKNESAENAALFNESLSIVGGGRMYVAYDVKAPVGVYTVSIKVENEGQSAVLEDIFTFVIETAEDATEGE